MKGSELQAGDVILSTTEATVSSVIRGGTWSNYSHAMLYVGAGNVVEAVGAGVLNHSIKIATAHATYADAFRLDMTKSQADKVVAYALTKVGGSYAYGGVFGGSGVVSILTLPLQPGLHLARWGYNKVKAGVGGQRTYFCSELVEDAFESEHLTVSRYLPSMTNPGDIAEYSDRNPKTFPKLGRLDIKQMDVG